MSKTKGSTKINAKFTVTLQSIVNKLHNEIANLAEYDDRVVLCSSKHIMERLNTSTCEKYATCELQIQLTINFDHERINARDRLNHKTLREMGLITAAVYKSLVKRRR